MYILVENMCWQSTYKTIHLFGHSTEAQYRANEPHIQRTHISTKGLCLFRKWWYSILYNMVSALYIIYIGILEH